MRFQTTMLKAIVHNNSFEIRKTGLQLSQALQTVFANGQWDKG